MTVLMIVSASIFSAEIRNQRAHKKFITIVLLPKKILTISWDFYFGNYENDRKN